MPYDNSIPLATDAISGSQQQLLDNFAALQTLLEINHVGFNVAGQGKHKFATFPNQVASPTTLANEIAVFARQSTLTLAPELAYRRQTNGAVVEMTSSLNAIPGWAFTSSGMLFKWGTGTALAADYPAGTVFTLPVAATIPVYGTVFIALITPTGVAADVMATLRGLTTVDFTVLGTQRTADVAANVTFNYLILGIV